MEVVIHHQAGQPVELLEGARAFETAPSVIAVLAEVVSLSGAPLHHIVLTAVAHNEPADFIGYDEVILGRLHGGERRPVMLRFRLLAEACAVIHLYVSCDESPDNPHAHTAVRRNLTFYRLPGGETPS